MAQCAKENFDKFNEKAKNKSLSYPSSNYITLKIMGSVNKDGNLDDYIKEFQKRCFIFKKWFLFYDSSYYLQFPLL